MPATAVVAPTGKTCFVPAARAFTSFEGFSDVGWRPQDATESTTVFTERDGITTWTATSRYPSKEVRDAVLHDPNMQTGMNEGFAALDAVLRDAA